MKVHLTEGEHTSLARGWLQTQGDGLVRADQTVGIDAHQTPARIGKPAH